MFRTEFDNTSHWYLSSHQHGQLSAMLLMVLDRAICGPKKACLLSEQPEYCVSSTLLMDGCTDPCICGYGDCVLGAYTERHIIRHSHDFKECSVHLKSGFNECVICARVFAYVVCLCMSDITVSDFLGIKVKSSM